MLEQLKYFLKDYQANAGRQKMRMLLLWINPSIIGILGYRIDRGFFLLFKGYWKYLRLVFLPIIYLIYIISRKYFIKMLTNKCEINEIKSIIKNLRIIILELIESRN